MGCASSKGGDGPIQFDPPKWTSDEPMTREDLKKKRETFWETEPFYGGRAECWQALRQAIEAKDRKTANSIITTAEMTLPNGMLTEAYDALGYKYDVPVYCIRNPSNLL